MHDAAGMPGNAMMFKFLIRTCSRKAVASFQILLMREEWNSGFLDSTQLDPFRTLTARNVRWLPTEGVKNIAADPFFFAARQ